MSLAADILMILCGLAVLVNWLSRGKAPRWLLLGLAMAASFGATGFFFTFPVTGFHRNVFALIGLILAGMVTFRELGKLRKWKEGEDEFRIAYQQASLLMAISMGLAFVFARFFIDFTPLLFVLYSACFLLLIIGFIRWTGIREASALGFGVLIGTIAYTMQSVYWAVIHRILDAQPDPLEVLSIFARSTLTGALCAALLSAFAIAILKRAGKLGIRNIS